MKINPAQNRKSASRRAGSRGWGSVETLLMAVGVYLLVSAGLNWFNDIQSARLTETKLRERAHQLVTIAETAKLAGLDFVIPGNIDATVDRISRGGVAVYGAYEGQFFGVPEMGILEKNRVGRFLKFRFEELTVIEPDSFASAH